MKNKQRNVKRGGARNLGQEIFLTPKERGVSQKRRGEGKVTRCSASAQASGSLFLWWESGLSGHPPAPSGQGCEGREEGKEQKGVLPQAERTHPKPEGPKGCRSVSTSTAERRQGASRHQQVSLELEGLKGVNPSGSSSPNLVTPQVRQNASRNKQWGFNGSEGSERGVLPARARTTLCHPPSPTSET